jgi:2,3-bisphosphoglycerate-independent phosphoglycerate mutase
VVGPDLLVILDGASEPPVGARPTSLEQARTPALDALARRGTLSRLRTVPAGLTAGSEVAIPVLLGCTPGAPVDRALVEAAAHAIDIPAGARAWRVDVLGPRGGRADAGETRRAARALNAGAGAHTVHRLAGHRLLLVGPEPLPDAARALQLRVWPRGAALPQSLDATTVVVAAPGAGAGVAALMGARVLRPLGATGGPDTDLHAKATAAADALEAGARRVVVHVGGADEAAHARDAAGKVTFLERADHTLLAPLVDVVARAEGSVRVCPDHGCDPATGEHDARPVPCVTWTAGTPGRGAARAARRMSERAVATLDVSDLTTSARAAA